MKKHKIYLHKVVFLWLVNYNINHKVCASDFLYLQGFAGVLSSIFQKNISFLTSDAEVGMSFANILS